MSHCLVETFLQVHQQLLVLVVGHGREREEVAHLLPGRRPSDPLSPSPRPPSSPKRCRSWHVWQEWPRTASAPPRRGPASARSGGRGTPGTQRRRCPFLASKVQLNRGILSCLTLSDTTSAPPIHQELQGLLACLSDKASPVLSMAKLQPPHWLS